MADPKAFTARDHPEARAKLLNDLAGRVSTLEDLVTGFVARKTASQTFNSGVGADILFPGEDYDVLSEFSSPTFTATMGGHYRFDFGLTHDATITAGDRWNVAVIRSGVMVFDFTYLIPLAGINSIGRSFSITLVAGDTLKLQMRRTGGAGQFVTVNDANGNYFSGSLVRAG